MKYGKDRDKTGREHSANYLRTQKLSSFRLAQTGESPSFLWWHRKFSLTRRSAATHRRSNFRVKMNTIVIFSLVILLFGFDSSSRNESIRFQR
jgi:hypothetical protein